MTTTTKPRKNSAALSARTKGLTALPTRARMRGQILAGLLLVVVSALLGALIFINAGDRVSVLAVRDGVPAGQKIARGDLVSRSVAGVEGAVAVSDVDQVVGRTVSVGLVPGQILSEQMLGEETVPGPGQALAGLALNPAQMPGDGLAAGDVVRVIGVPSTDASVGELGEVATVLAETAIVYSVREDVAGDSNRVVTVVVPSGSATTIAAHAAASRVAIVKTALPGGGS